SAWTATTCASSSACRSRCRRPTATAATSTPSARSSGTCWSRTRRYNPGGVPPAEGTCRRSQGLKRKRRKRVPLPSLTLHALTPRAGRIIARTSFRRAGRLQRGLLGRLAAEAQLRRVEAHLGLLVGAEARARRHQVAQDHVLLQADQVIDLAGQRRLGQHLGRLLEARRRDKALRLYRRLGDAQQLRAACRQRRRHERRQLAVLALQAGALLLERLLADDLAGVELALAGVLDLHALLEPLVDLAEDELVDDAARQQRRVAHRLDLHLAEHLRHGDLDVLVVDVHALAAVDRL